MVIVSYVLTILVLSDLFITPLSLPTQPAEFIHTLGDAHVYTNHIEPLAEQVGPASKPSFQSNTLREAILCRNVNYSQFHFVPVSDDK